MAEHSEGPQKSEGFGRGETALEIDRAIRHLDALEAGGLAVPGGLFV